MSLSFEISLFLCLDSGSLLLDASFLTGEFAQVVQLGATYLTNFVHLDGVDVRRLNGENTLHTHGARHLANGETSLFTIFHHDR